MPPVLYGDLLIIYVQATFQGVQPGHRQRCFAHVDCSDIGASVRHALGQDAAAAADIQHPFAIQLHPLINVVQAQWVDVVQRFEFTLLIPPAVSHGFKFGNFGGVYIKCAHSDSCL